jgi:ApaG protein
MTKSRLKVSVQTQFLPEQSSAKEKVFTFAYFVTVENMDNIAAQVIARHWIIEDASGHRQEVKGLGVVGQQPLIQPGEKFSYNSGTRIASPVGSMHGVYFCMAEDATAFEVPIPLFVLKAEGLNASDGPPVMLH